MSQSIAKPSDLFPRLTQWIWILAGALLLRISTFGMPPLFDTTESRYANMIQHFFLRHDWLVGYSPDFHAAFLGKPPFSLWMGGLSLLGFGANEWALRFPNLIAAVLVVVATFYWAKHLSKDRTTAGLSVLLLMACGFFNVSATTISMDMWVCASVTWALLACFHLLVKPSERENPTPQRRWYAVLTLALIVGVMSKGLLPVVMTLGPVLLWMLVSSSWEKLKNVAWLWVLLAVVGATLPWFLAVQARYPDFLYYFFVQEHFLRYLKPDYGDRYGNGHLQPYGSSLLFFVLATLPSILLPVLHLPAALKSFQAQNRLNFLPQFLRTLQQSLQPKTIDVPQLFLIMSMIFAPFFFMVAKSLLITYIITAIPPACIVLARLLQKRLPQHALKIGFVLASTVTLGIALWFGAWSLGSQRLQSSELGRLIFPDYRSMRRAVHTLQQENPDVLSLPVYGWCTDAPFSWLFYLQNTETEKARVSLLKGVPYRASSVARQEPFRVESIEALAQIKTPFLLVVRPRNTEKTALLTSKWPPVFQRQLLSENQKGVTLYEVTTKLP
ncbi:MAG: phospholipid carrier-dependent glycosyltransferase [Vampirovibrio sp.]